MCLCMCINGSPFHPRLPGPSMHQGPQKDRRSNPGRPGLGTEAASQPLSGRWKEMKSPHLNLCLQGTVSLTVCSDVKSTCLLSSTQGRSCDKQVTGGGSLWHWPTRSQCLRGPRTSTSLPRPGVASREQGAHRKQSLLGT